jgi:hypothetical protein
VNERAPAPSRPRHCCGMFLLTFSASVAALAVSSNAWRDWVTQQSGDWRGTWCTHGPDGTLLDRVAAGTTLAVNGALAVQSHQVSVEMTRSDCERCFDRDGEGWFNGATMRTLPAGSFTPETMRHVVCGAGSAFGPRVLRSGAMTLELSVRHADRRVRAVCTWQPQSMAAAPLAGNAVVPISLVLGRVTIAREALQAAADAGWEPPCIAQGPWRGSRSHLAQPVAGIDEPSALVVSEVVCDSGGKPPQLERGIRSDAPGGSGAPLQSRGDGRFQGTAASLAEEAGGAGTRVLLDTGGGITMGLPSRILPASPACVELQWEASAVAVRRVEARVEGLGRRVVESEASVAMAPPTLCELAVVAWDAKA